MNSRDLEILMPGTPQRVGTWVWSSAFRRFGGSIALGRLKAELQT